MLPKKGRKREKEEERREREKEEKGVGGGLLVGSRLPSPEIITLKLY